MSLTSSTDRSGKVVHEVTPDGAGVLRRQRAIAGNTDETAKFPSAVALIWRWTGDDAFRDGMYPASPRAQHALHRPTASTVTTTAGPRAWAMSSGRAWARRSSTTPSTRSVGCATSLRPGSRARATAQVRRPGPTTIDPLPGTSLRATRGGTAATTPDQYADSLDGPGNDKVFQRHWIGVTPMDAMLPKPGTSTRPLASQRHGVTALQQRQRTCYTGRFGLYHTGTPGCDSAVSSVPSERNVFSLNTAIMAVAEGNFGRLGPQQQQYYTTGNARIQLGPRVWEMPGAMPEIAPEGDFTPNIDRPFNERSMVLQAWGAYGNLWPVVHQQLGVSPNLGRDRLRIVPQIPNGQHRISGRNIRLGGGSVDVSAARRPDELRTVVDVNRAGVRVRLGHVLPDVASVRRVLAGRGFSAVGGAADFARA